MTIASKNARRLVAVLAGVLMLGLLEAALRIFDFPPSHPDPKQEWAEAGCMQDPLLPWSWIPIPGAAVRFDGNFLFRFNAQGFRGRPCTLTRRAGLFRIACLGDSCTVGFGVSADGDTYPSQLQRMLQRTLSGHRFETINAGVIGYTSFQGLHQLKTRILPLQPNVIIMSYNWNDHQFAIQPEGSARRISDRELSTLRHSASPGRLESLRTFQLVRLLVWKTHQSRPKRVDPLSVSVRVPPDDFAANIRSMVHVARENQMIPIIMTQPIRPTLPEPAVRKLARQLELTTGADWKQLSRVLKKMMLARQAEYNKLLVSVAAEQSVPCLDMADAFASASADTRPFFADFVHPSRKGARIIAEKSSAAVLQLLKSNR